MDDDNQNEPKATRAQGVARRSHARVEHERDLEVMRWIARFRFVTTVGVSERFGVTERALRTRVARLEAQQLVRLDRSYRQPTSISLTRAGTDLLGLPPRNPPRIDALREHELAIVWQVAHFEKHRNPRLEVLTERECRELESRDGLGPFHVRAAGERSSGARGQRWPDLVLIVDGTQRIAVELELSAKHTPRLQRIVAGYLLSHYDRVVFYVDDLRLARRLVQLRDAEIARHLRGRPASSGPLKLPRFDVDPWPHAAPERIDPIRAWFAATAAAQEAVA